MENESLNLQYNLSEWNDFSISMNNGTHLHDQKLFSELGIFYCEEQEQLGS